MEGQESNITSDVELEEEIIPNETSEGGLEDVVPCEYVAIEQQDGGSFDMVGTSNDGFYDYNDTAPSVNVDKMVDIAPQNAGSSADELEEVEIPQEHNLANDEQLDDVIS